jgi:carbon-monoxide dehydrogenase medium subunit
MKPPAFSYHDPENVADVIGLLARLENARLLAGGQSLMPMLNMRFVLPDHLIDLGRVAELAYLREAPSTIEIGAMTRQRDLEFSPLVQHRLPLMAEAIRLVGHRQTRNRGTLGGSLCHLDPAAEMVSVAAALEATFTIQAPSGTRTVAYQDFPAGYMTSSVGLDEILTGIAFPCWPAGHGYGFVEFSRRHGDFAIVSAAALLLADIDGRITRAALAIGGIAAAPVRVTEVEQALIGQVLSGEKIEKLCEPCRSLAALGDALVSAEYRQHLAPVMARRALIAAHARLAHG